MDSAEAFGLLLYVSIVVGILYVNVAVIYWVVGSDKYRGFLLWGLVLLVIGSSGLGVITWLFEGSGQGADAWGSGVIVVPSNMSIDASKYFPVEVRAIPVVLPQGSQGRANMLSIRVDWGDGSTSDVWSSWGSPLEPLLAEHAYWSDGQYTVRINVTAYVADLGPEGPDIYETIPMGEYTLWVNVSAPWEQYASVIRSAFENVQGNGTIGSAFATVVREAGKSVAWAFEHLTDFIARFTARIGLNPGDAYYYLVTLPTSKNMPGIRETYEWVKSIALIALFALALLDLLWKGIFRAQEGSEPLIEWIRNLILAGAAIYMALPLYDYAATLWNTISLSIARLGQLGGVYAMIASMSLISTAAGVISPGAAQIGGIGVIILILTVLLGVLKYIVAATLVAALPMLIALSMFEGIRPLATGAIRTLAGLFLFTFLAAVLTNLTVEFTLNLAATEEGRSLILAFAIPLVVGLGGYYITSMIMPGALPGSGLIAYKMLGRGGAAAAGAAIATPAMAGILPTRPPTPYPPTTVPGPATGAPGYATSTMSGAIVGSVPTPSTARTSRLEAQVYSLAPGRTIGEKIRSTGTRLAEFARGESKPAPEAPRHVKAAYHAARATGLAARGTARALRKIAPHVKRNTIEFDRILQRELGISLIEKPITKRAIPAAKHTYRAARWVTPRIKSGAPKLARMIGKKLPVRKALVRETREGSYEEA